MSLRPFANLFCVFDPVPERLDGFEHALSAGDEFEVRRPADGWVAAVAPLPGGPPEASGLRAAGLDGGKQPARLGALVFCEGADRVLASHDQQEVARLALDAPHRLAGLPGDFTFVSFGVDGPATAVRSCGGLVPIYRWSEGEVVAVGTRLDYFVRFLPGPPALDPLVNAVWTTGWAAFPDGRTFLDGVSILERGHYLRLPGRQIGSYWDPRPREGDPPRPDPDRPRRLREILIETLTRDLVADATNLLTLSGGVDSSSIGALAAGTLGFPLAALSFLPPDPEGHRRDEHYIDLVAAKYRFNPHWRLLLDTSKRIELLSRRHQSCFPMVHPALGILPELHAETPIGVLVGGEYADEVVGTLALLPDWAAHTSLRALIGGGRASWPTGTYRDLGRWAKRRLMHVLRQVQMPFPEELPEMIRPELRQEYAEWFADQRRRAGRDPRPLRQLALSGRQDPFVVMNWEGTSPLGIRRSLPFFNREVLELAFLSHPSEQVGPGSKKLLRAALREDVPEESLNRQDKGTSPLAKLELPWTEELDDLLEPILGPDWFPRPSGELDQMDAWRLAILSHIARGYAGAIAGRANASGVLDTI